MPPKGGSKGKKGAADDAAGAGKLKGAQSLKIKHILAPSHSKAMEASAKLDAGESFDKVAKEYSTDKVALGWKQKGELDPAFWTVAYDLAPSSSDKPVHNKRQLETIIIDDDDDDSDNSANVSQTALADHGEAEFQRELQRAVELSLREAAQASANQPGPNRTVETSNSNPVQSRAEMEQARLARQRQREEDGLSQTAATLTRPAQRRRVATIADVTGAEQPLRSENDLLGHMQSSVDSGAQRFWQGRLMRVHNLIVPAADALTFAQVVNKRAGLERAVVGAYVLDPLWVAQHFDDQTPLLLIMPQKGGAGKTEARYGQIMDFIKSNTFCSNPEVQKFFERDSLMLYYTDFCRIVIPTANAINYDWDTIDNASASIQVPSMYIQDFPKRQAQPKDAPRTNPTNTQFTIKLLDVLKSLHVPLLWVLPFINYDFRVADQVRLVHSTPGFWIGWDEIAQGGGHPSMAQLVQAFDLGQQGLTNWSIETQCSSVGTYSKNWLHQFAYSCTGRHPASYYSSKTPVPAGTPSQCQVIKVIYPTRDEIVESWGGVNHGGTIFCPDSAWESAKKMGNLFFKCVSKRARVPMHTKTVLALNKATHKGFIYIGSHNFSSAAWGTLQTNSKTRQPQLFIRNYELGVLLPLQGHDESSLQQQASDLATYVRPVQPYGPNDKPWRQQHG
ncbi:hypothetical protein OIV83_002460 [Microbotryomycetes sp. JL201]|nr:hypothetical protein OIV83_002460 [Microbotryomycetes sp. JL201]